MKTHITGRCRVPAAFALVAAVGLVAAATASAHARISPPVSLSNTLQLYSLVVPTEKEGATTSKVVLTVPAGFSIDSFVAAPGWTRQLQQTGSGENAVIQKVTWTGGAVPTEEDALFQFLGEPAKNGTYTFTVQQTYSNGEVVNWSDPESGADPSPAIQAKSSLGGGGTPLLTIVALVIGGLGVLIGGIALLAGGGGGGGKRQLA